MGGNGLSKSPWHLPRGLRDDAIVALREQEYLTLEEIGQRFNLTRERVRQILVERGIDPTGSQGGHARQSRRRVEAALARSEDVLAMYRTGAALENIATTIAGTVPAVTSVLRKKATALDEATRRQSLNAQSAASSQRFTDHDLIAAVRKVAEHLGRVPSSNDYAAVAPAFELPSLPTIHNRMGWAAAVRSAGMEPRRARRSTYTRRWDATACLAAVSAVADELGKIPSVAEYDRISRGRPDLPAAATVRNRCGGWAAVRVGLAT